MYGERFLPIIKRPTPILNILNRLVNREAVFGETVFEEYGVPRPWIPATGEYIDTKAEELARRKVEEWKAKGAREGLIRMALELASGWTTRMLEWMTRYVPEEEKARLQKMMAIKVYEKALEEVADEWIEKMMG